MIAYLPDAPAPEGAPRLTEKAAHAQGYPLVLGWHEGRLGLWPPLGKATPLFVDFQQGALGYRLQRGRAQHERLVKALGRLPEQSVVVDATAGLGRDSALLAAAGYQVLMIEEQAPLQLLLEDALAHCPSTLSLRLLKGTAQQWLPTLTPQVVYLDPMFPERRKSAAVKKELAWLQHIAPIPAVEEEQELLTLARQVATHKVVVKRPAKAPYLAQETPSSQLNGKAVRFDVYLPLP